MGVIPDWLRLRRTVVTEAAAPKAPATPPRAGYEHGIPPGGLTETQQGLGGASQTDRRSVMTELYDAYVTCPWAWTAVNAIARTVTGGGLVTDWDNDDGDGDQDPPPKPPEVLALERLLAYCNPREDIRQLLRGVVTDLQVFGDAFIEVVWFAGIPVALYSLDSPSMRPLADKHGTVSGYVQRTELGQRATFDPHEVIHISLDSPRSGVFGVSPTQAALLPITAWLFAAATAKETYRKGKPPKLRVDFPAATQDTTINRWDANYATRNIGPRNIGVPIITKGGANVGEMQHGAMTEDMAFMDQKRDEILAAYGVPPAQAGVIESGNLGGGTGESQRKMFLTNTCDPIGELILEKLQFHLAVNGFGVQGWRLKFGEVDMRDSETVEKIRDMRVRNGTWTVNRARVDIGEAPVEGGDDAVIIDRQNMVLVRDLAATSQAGVAAKAKGSGLEPEEPQDGKGLRLVKEPPAPTPAPLAPFAGQQPPGQPPQGQPEGKPPVEAVDVDAGWRAVSEAWTAQYRARRARALAELPALAGAGR